MLDAENRFEKVNTATACGVWDWDIASGRSEWSPELFVLFDRDPETFLPGMESWLSTIYPDDLASVRGMTEMAVRDNKILNVEYRIVLRDGEIRWINTVGRVSCNESMQPVHMMGVCTDISNRKRSDGLKNIYNRIVNTTHDGFWMTDMLGNVLEVNQAYADMTGYSIDELVNMHVSQLDVLDDTQKVKSRIDTMVAEGQVLFETKHRHKDGQILDLEVSAHYMADQKLCFGFFRDITVRKKSEGLLQFHSNILSTMATGIFLIRTGDGNIVYTNPKFERMFGYTAGELLGKHVSIVNAATEISPQMTAIKINRELERVGLWKGEVLNVKKNGTPFWCQVSIVTMEHPEFGNVWVSSHTDITERKNVQSELESMLEFSNKLISSMNDGVVILDKHGRIQDVNAALCLMTGFVSEALIGTVAPFPYWPPEDSENILVHLRRTLSGVEGQFELLLMRQSGERFPVIISPAAVRNSNGDIASYIVTIKDVSRIKAAEEAILNVRKAVHRDLLVREVHHRIKNNLQGITGILRAKANTSPELSASIQEVIGQINSVAVIHGLQGRTGMSQVRLCELTSVISAEIEKLWHAKIAVGIPLNWVPYSVQESEAVPIALILNELISNATKHSHDRSVSIDLRTEANLDCVVLSIRNAGHLPAVFGLGNPGQFGTGLQLVASLMPFEGVSLFWEQHNNEVTTTLKIYTPIVQLENEG